ncbi:MAG: tetratricopeptide repeat protein [Trueperaceae bacterium]|nr:tetratricopeptide repeat protein [Trueperaceae bacterium]
MLNNLGEVARLQSDHARAEGLYREGLALHRTLGNQRGAAITLGNLGFVAHREGKVEEAAALLLESIALKHHLGDEIGLAYCFAGLAAVLCDDGAYVLAARLLGTAEGLIRTHAVQLDAADRTDHAACVARCRTNLGDEAYAAAADEGRAMEIDAAVATALASREDVRRRTS